MSVLTQLRDTAIELEAELAKEGTVVTDLARTKFNELKQNIEHELQKEISNTVKPSLAVQTPPVATGQQVGTSGVQTSSDLSAS